MNEENKTAIENSGSIIKVLKESFIPNSIIP